MTGLLFLAVALVFFDSADSATWLITAYYLIILSILVVIFVYDWLYMEIPGVVLWAGVAIAIAFNLMLDWSGGGQANLLARTFSGTLAAAAAFVFFFLLSALSKEKWMGMGDAYLVILLGLFLGWPRIILAVFASFFIGSIYGIIVIAMGKKKMKSRIPFAPFLAIGTVIALFFHAPIVNWYFSLFF